MKDHEQAGIDQDRIDNFNSIEVLEGQIRECFGKIVWTQTTHEKCANILKDRAKNIKILQIILSAITTTGIVVSLIGENKWGIGITGVISATLLCLNTYVKDNDIASVAQEHANCACHLWNLREKYFSLLTDIRSGFIKPDEIRIIRNKLQEEVYSVYQGAPRSFGKAYNEASIGLKENEEQTLSDEEIDAFLPIQLKKANKESIK